MRADIPNLLRASGSLRVSHDSDIFNILYVFVRHFDDTKVKGQSVAEQLFIHVCTACNVLEETNAGFEEKDDAFETIKVAIFFLCWLCTAVQPAQADVKSSKLIAMSKDSLAVWRATLGALRQAFAVDFTPFREGEHHARSLINQALKQVCAQARQSHTRKAL
eukprot:jgi/Ulvmu1/3184/UM015_0225.1